MAEGAFVQEVVSDEETESNAEGGGGDSNRMYTNNPQEKEDFIKVTSKDQKVKALRQTPIHCSYCFLPH